MKIKHIEIANFRGIKSLSWHVSGNFNCIIGAGDTCKSTILKAVDCVLYPHAYLPFYDSDFFNQDVEQDIIIQVTLADWDEQQAEIKNLFRESKFAQFKCGFDETGPLREPLCDGQVAVSVSLHVDKNHEPKWFVVKGRYEEADDSDKKNISAADRAILGVSRLDILSDLHFTWSRNSILTRLSEGHVDDLSATLSELARDINQTDIAGGIAECQSVAETVKKESDNVGVRLKDLSAKINIQRQSMNTGVLSLHEDNVPLRNKGSGSKNLIAVAMQMKLYGGKNISLIDEIETGLEPQRIRGLVFRLKNSGQQIFTTTHSPVVIRELNVSDNDLYVCRRDAEGVVSLESLATVPDIQRHVRGNAEAFLGKKIVVCEGSTEIGCLRAYDIYKFEGNSTPVWSLSTSYFNSGGAGQIKLICQQLVNLGYQVAVLCDNDAEEQLSEEDVEHLSKIGVHICQWDSGNSTENQIFYDCPWSEIPKLLKKIAENHDRLEFATVIDCIKKHPLVATQNLDSDPAKWSESLDLRKAIGDLAKKNDWIKRVDYAEKVFTSAFPFLLRETVLMSRLDALWNWMQNE